MSIFILQIIICNIDVQNKWSKVEIFTIIGNEVKEKLNKYLKVISLKNLKNEIEDSDIIINATSVGMFPNADKCPIKEYYILYSKRKVCNGCCI